MRKNDLILPYCIHEKHYAIKIGSIYSFSHSDTKKFHKILGYHPIDITYSLIF